MEELFLGPVFTGEKLDVVDQQDVDRPVAGPEIVHPSFLDGGDHLVHELLARHIGDPPAGVLFQNGVADGVHQVGLAQTNAAIEEERVVGLGGGFCHRPAGGVREARVVADHEMLELEFRIQLGCLVEDRLLGFGRRLLSDGHRRAAGGCLSLTRYHLERHADVAGDDRRQRLFDHRRVAVLEPVLGELGRHADLESILLAADQ